MTRLFLMMNRKLGLNVLRYLLSLESNVSCILINSETKKETGYDLEVQKVLDEFSLAIPIYRHNANCWDDKALINLIESSTHSISVLFGHLIPEKVINHFGKNIVNLHPSLLPIGRGSDPIPWSIIENRPQGVSIHEVTNDLDCGPILCQELIPSTINLNAGDIYNLAMVKLEELFKKVYLDWVSDKLISEPQNGFFTYHKKEDLRQFESKAQLEIERLVRIAQALTFNDGRTPHIRLQSQENLNYGFKLVFTSDNSGKDYLE
jgi:methionyl-tRNA formyltransferase